MNTIFIWKSHLWYVSLGFQDRELVDLKITCPNQSNVPGYSTTPLPLTTVTATVTATTVATTTTNASEGSDPRSTADFATVTQTTPATNTTITSEGSDSGIADELGDEKSSGDTILMFLRSLCLRLSIT